MRKIYKKKRKILLIQEQNKQLIGFGALFLKHFSYFLEALFLGK